MSTSEPLSLFALLRDDLGERLPPIQATKATLVDVSHTLEDLVITERLPAMLFTGFQESSHWREETERYRELAGVAHQICIFAGGDLPPESDQRHIHVRLHGPDPLRQEWFLLALSPRFAAVLCGRDLQTSATSEAERTFDTLWSFEPPIIARTLELLRDVVARERPDRLAGLEDAIGRFPPPPPDPRLVTIFTTRLISNLTRQHQARLHLERALASESRLRALGQVLSGVAHELNNPLQSILGFASLIADAPAPEPEMLADARHIVEAAERAQQIVRSLLQLARPAASGFAATDLAALVQHTLIFVRADLKTHSIRVDISAEPPGLTALVNPVRIQQLLINLLTNAVQALARHPPPRQIQIHLAAEPDGGVALAVRDNGPGIPPRLLDRIFEPFFTTKAVGEGTGLGLSIVRTIVQEHGGTVAVESTLGQGTAFLMRFPPASGISQLEAEPQLRARRGAVLVIDDDSQVNALIARVLVQAGHQVQTETNPLVARQRLVYHNYEAIICDLSMPGMSGMELYEELMHVSPALAQRLIFVTGDATRPMTQVFLEGTGLPYLLKPFTPKQLLAALAQAMPPEPDA
ncbi:MAG TPA: ATP-binding protein [Roseiflexaceae bacterium]|nr:ATP-binding protein [Roseiflexaceae bacterium]